MSDDRRVLAERARRLARPLERAAPAGLEAIVFRLAGERFALPVEDVLRIVPVGELAPLPGARPPVTALAPWRGTLLPVLDLRLLRRPGTGIGDLTRILVLEDDRRAVGILAEAVEGIEDVDLAQLDTTDDATDQRHVRGILPDARVLLDAAGLLGLQRGG